VINAKASIYPNNNAKINAKLENTYTFILTAHVLPSLVPPAWSRLAGRPPLSKFNRQEGRPLTSSSPILFRPANFPSSLMIDGLMIDGLRIDGLMIDLNFLNLNLTIDDIWIDDRGIDDRWIDDRWIDDRWTDD
jgi:hypothetical protein